MTTLLQQYFNWMQSREGMQVSETTAKKYLRICRKFVQEYGWPSDLNQSDIERWYRELDTMQEQQAAPSTINVIIAAVKSLFRYTYEKGMRSDNPIEDTPLVKIPKRIPRPVTKDVITQIYKEIEASDDPLAPQDFAILEVLYGSGVRRAEAASITLGQIVEDKYLRIIGKRDKERITILTESAYLALRAWSLHTHGDERTQWLRREISDAAAFDDLRKRKPEVGVFVTEKGAPVKELPDPGHFIWLRMRPYFEKFDVTPHQMRHSFATHLLTNKVSPYTVALLLGHSDMNTVRMYDGVDPEAFSDVRYAHPRTRGEINV